MENYIVGDPMRFNEYDIRRKEMNDTIVEVINFLNRDDIRKMINTTDRDFFIGEEGTCNWTVEDEFVYD